MEKEYKNKKELKRYAKDSIKNIKASVSDMTADEAFLQKKYGKLSQDTRYGVIKSLFKASVVEYRDTRKELVRNNIETKKYDKKVSDITSKLDSVPVEFN